MARAACHGDEAVARSWPREMRLLVTPSLLLITGNWIPWEGGGVGGGVGRYCGVVVVAALGGILCVCVCVHC